MSIPQTAPVAGQPENWSIHVQYTLVGQGYPRFRSPYQGQNSLPGGTELRETMSQTTYLGRRLWDGGELYFNPEFNQGFGLADTFGLAGFPNAEAQKAGFHVPKLNVARFYRSDPDGVTLDLNQKQWAFRFGIHLHTLSTLAAIVLLCWPVMCGAQMVGPTPQPPGIPVTPEEAEQVQPENWAIHGQSTGTWLLQPAFRSPYQGPQSLRAGANGRETIDATLYAGVRPWPGAEIWINPEVDQGFGLSDTFGVAGYPSGEAYKVGKAEPYFLVQRGFLRQTINLGGETEKLDPGLNQLGGTQTADRVVFTVGKFSIVDIFDTNAYAHDPRNDFFNWSIIDQGAFDYAANAWGYTYGGAVEWYQDWWTARAGVFDLSQFPNSVALSRGFAQGQFVGELEERHNLWDQPGKLKFLYWLTRGYLGTYLDAIALGAATGQTPSPRAVARFRTKDGFGLNLEQQIATNLGVFARASMSQGTVEEVDFTDINQSVSAGLSLTGSRWGRPDDTVGLAGAINRISHQGKLYLAAGGLGGIIGDGQLPNAGPEQILEIYYNVAVFSFAHFTAGYQFINHPAYNRDRGPVSVFGLRLHLQY